MAGPYAGRLHAPSDGARESATARVYDTLKREILTCELAPGSPLYEGQLAERLDVSKTPVRDALGMLIHEGFVTVQPRQGYRVSDITLADVQEVFHMRMLLEPAAAELAAERATAEQLKRLQHLAEESYVYGDVPTYEEFVVKNREFHVLLAEASGNERLAAALRNLLEEMQRLFLFGLDIRDSAEEQINEHRELVDALLKGNHHLAREIATRQIETSRKRVMEALLGEMSGPNGKFNPGALKLGGRVRS
jgi:GntR family transcriptional regulator, rspAB operon transcriptional repressor